jgi:putative Ca2+/H+ antiporter (TMEM165/GDT1 family)
VAIIAFIIFLVGALLASRFTVLSLLLSTMLALLCTAAVGVVEGARVLSILVAMFVVWAAFQLGYFAGLCAFQSGDWKLSKKTKQKMPSRF